MNTFHRNSQLPPNSHFFNKLKIRKIIIDNYRHVNYFNRVIYFAQKKTMSQQKRIKSEQGSILSELAGDDYLDTIRLEKLEQNFREWVEASARTDVRLSRKRILLLFLLIRYTEAKLSEILNLNPVKDIDFAKRKVLIKAVGSEDSVPARDIPVSKVFAAEIASMLSDHEFSTLIKDKLSVDPGFVRRKFYERATSCGFDKKLGGPEMIRKARAVELMQSKMPIPAVQSLLGHSTPNLTQSMVSFSQKEIGRLTTLYMEEESGRKTSARNSFFGKISAIEKGDVLSRVEVATIDGFCVTTTITNSSLLTLGLKKSRLVTCEVKAPLVILQNVGKQTSASTADNLFSGVITHINKGQIHTEYLVKLSEMTELCSITTTESFRQLNLKEGDPVQAMFNSFVAVLNIRKNHV